MTRMYVSVLFRCGGLAKRLLNRTRWINFNISHKSTQRLILSCSDEYEIPNNMIQNIKKIIIHPTLTTQLIIQSTTKPIIIDNKSKLWHMIYWIYNLKNDFTEFYQLSFFSPFFVIRYVKAIGRHRFILCELNRNDVV